MIRKMRFSPMFHKLTSNLYQKRFVALSINDLITKVLALSREVQKGDSISALLFVIEMTSLCKIIELYRRTCDIQLSRGVTLPTGTFFANNSFLIAKLAADAVRLYQEAETYCQISGAVLHQGKYVASPMHSADTLALSSRIRIQLAGKARYFWVFLLRRTSLLSRFYKTS